MVLARFGWKYDFVFTVSTDGRVAIIVVNLGQKSIGVMRQ